MPTGWRPEDVKTRFPVLVLTDVTHQVKYSSPATWLLKALSWFQLAAILILQLYFFNHLSLFNWVELLEYALFIFLSVVSLTEMMNRSRWSWMVELIRWAMGLFWIGYRGDWFQLDQLISGGSVVVLVYLSISLLAQLYFRFLDESQKESRAVIEL